MNLDELRAVRRKERQKDSLQHLRDTFYADVAEYIQTLKEERREAAQSADDPFSSPEVSRLTDEIETAEEVVEAIYERRVGKVVKLSSFAAADMNADEEGLTAEERDLFEDLVGRIKRNRSTVLDILGGEAPPGGDGPADADPETPDAGGPPDTGTGPGVDVTPEAPADAPAAAPPESPESGSDDAGSDATAPGGDVLADAMGADAGDAAGDDDVAEQTEAEVEADAAGDDPDPASAAGHSDPADATEAPRPTPPPSESDDAGDGGDGAAEDRTTVRVTRDVGRIFGVDEREYELASEDVVALPTPNAEPLIERDAAERIE